MPSRRRAAGFGQFRRRGGRWNAGGVQYLLDYNNATFTRASEASYVDPRDGWAFVAQSTDWRTAELTWPALASWTDTGTPVKTTGVADHLGGTAAVTIEDNDAASHESVAYTYPGVLLHVGRKYRMVFHIAKDAVGKATRVPEIQVLASGYVYWNIDTATGETGIRAQNGFTNVSVSTGSEDVTGWWTVTVTWRASVATTLKITYLPSIGTGVPATATVTSVGSGTFYPRLELDGEGSWLPTNAPRIFSDGAILIEGARTNLLTTQDLSTWSGSAYASTTTGPDGASNAYVLTDDSAVATEAMSSSTLMLALAGSTQYTWSCYVEKDLSATQAVGFDFSESGGGTGLFRAQIIPADGTSTLRAISGMTGGSVAVRDAGDWWHLRVTATTTAGATNGVITISPGQHTALGGTSAAAEGSATVALVRVEAGAFPSSPIRTSGATATRARDAAEVPAASQFGETANAGAITFDFWPEFSSADIVTSGADPVLFGGVGGNCRIQLATGGPNLFLAVYDSAGALIMQRACTFSALQKITVTYDGAAGDLTIAGATTGDGTTSATPGSLSTGVAYRIGCHGASTSDVYQFYGVISKIRLGAV